jgi:hypothetical protein
MDTIYRNLWTEIEDYWAEEHGLTDDKLDAIDWTATRRATKNYPWGKHKWLIKHATGHCGTGKMMLLRQHQDHSMCPRCEAPVEDSRHVLLCQNTRATEQWRVELLRLWQWLLKHHTHPNLVIALCTFLQSWHSGRPFVIQPTWDSSVQSAMRQQASMEAYFLTLGRVVSDVTGVQRQYLSRLPTQLTAGSWTHKFTRELWDIGFFMWQHRNAIRHSPDHPWTNESRESYLSLIWEQFALDTSTLLQRDWHLLSGHPQEFQGHTLAQMGQWLHTIDLARQAYYDHQTSSLQTGNTNTASRARGRSSSTNYRTQSVARTAPRAAHRRNHRAPSCSSSLPPQRGPTTSMNRSRDVMRRFLGR